MALKSWELFYTYVYTQVHVHYKYEYVYINRRDGKKGKSALSGYLQRGYFPECRNLTNDQSVAFKTITSVNHMSFI